MLPVAYARYSEACRVTPSARNHMSFLLVKAQPGVLVEDLCGRIRARTGLLALTKEQFCWWTMRYYLKMSGIPVNFAITVSLGFIVGVAVAGQTFYLFTLEHLKQFAILKAMGVSNVRLVGMILLQASIVGTVGYGLGMGLTALFFEATKHMPQLQGFYLPWQVLAGTGLAVVLIAGLSSLACVRRVLVLEPAIVFRS
jgi:putative ABC transport system permease protein